MNPLPTSGRARRFLTVAVALVALVPGWSAASGDSGPGTVVSIDGETGRNGWWTTTPLVTLSCTPSPCTSETRLDGGAWATYDGTFAVTAPGTHLLEARSRTPDGQVGPIAMTTLAVDVAPPETGTTISGATGDDGWLVGPATATWTCQDDASGCDTTTYSLDGAPGRTATGPVTIDTDGTHTLRFRSSDHAGWHEPVRERSIAIDQEAPLVVLGSSCDAPGASGWCRGGAAVTAAVSDATSGVVDALCRAEGVPFSCTGGITLSGDGQHEVAATARDAAGHVTDSGLTVLVDSTAPDVALTANGPTAADGTYIGPITIQATCHDATSGCTGMSRVEADGETPWHDPLVIDEDGTHVVTVRATDVAGNEDTATLTLRFDGAAPSQSHELDGPRGSDDWFVGPVTVSLGCADSGAGCVRTEYRLDGGPTTTYTDPFVVASDAPLHHLSYTSTDAAGHTSVTNETTFRIDATPPTIATALACSAPGDAGWCRGTVTSTVTADDETSGVRSTACTLDGTPQDCGAVALSTDGAPTLQVRSEDQAGLVTTQETVLRRDTTAPTVAFEATCAQVGDGGWCGAPVVVTPVVADALSGVQAADCHINGVLTACDELVADTSGHASVVVLTRDMAGNTGGDSHQVRVDLEAPVPLLDATCASGWQGDWCGGPVHLRGLGSDGMSGLAELVCLANGVPVPCSGHDLQEDGRYTLEVRARDRAGHTATVMQSVGVDQTPPELSWSDPEAGCTYVDDSPVVCGGPTTTAIGTLTLTADATDDTSGVRLIVVRIDDQERARAMGPALTWAWDEVDAPPVQHRVAVIAEDMAGHRTPLEMRVMRAA